MIWMSRLDGVSFQDPEAFDLGFDGPELRGFTQGNPAYRVELSTEVPSGSGRSLQVASVSEESGELTADGAAELATRIHAELMADADRFRADAPLPADVDWALHNAHIVSQCLRSRASASFGIRDQSMAENVAWILEQNPGQKIVLWAHNGHVARDEGWMGGHLAARFGDDYFPVGFATGSGSYYAWSEGGLGVHPLTEPPPGSIESFFAGAGMARAVLDLRAAPEGAFVHQRRLIRSIGALAMDEQFAPAIVSKRFDALIYIDETTAARQPRQRSGSTPLIGRCAAARARLGR